MIKNARERKGLSQSQLAKKLKLSASHVNRMERKVKGFRASYSTIKLLSKELEICPIEIFLFFSEIDCDHIKKVSKFRKLIKCGPNICITDDIKIKAMQNRINRCKRLDRENKKLKKQLKIKISRNRL